MIRLFNQLRQLIADNPVPFIILALTLAFGTVGGAFLSHWLRRREDERKDELVGRTRHLEVLKQSVLQPILAYMDEYMLPIFRREASNVDVCFRLLRNPAAPLEQSVMEHFICTRVVAEALKVYTFGKDVVPPIPDPPAGPLVNDAREHHFQALMHTWGELVDRFGEYNRDCVQYVETQRKRIVVENPFTLPEFRLQANGSEWVNAAALAVIMFFRQIGLPTRELVLKADGAKVAWIYGAGLSVATGTVGRLVPLEAHFGKLLAERDPVQPLMDRARSLGLSLTTLRANIGKQQLVSKLPGKLSIFVATSHEDAQTRRRVLRSLDVLAEAIRPSSHRRVIGLREPQDYRH
jgi:hypothetical protein